MRYMVGTYVLGMVGAAVVCSPWMLLHVLATSIIVGGLTYSCHLAMERPVGVVKQRKS
jgi:hypothetical protein